MAVEYAASQLESETREAEPAFRELLEFAQNLMLRNVVEDSVVPSTIPAQSIQNGWHERQRLEQTYYNGDATPAIPDEMLSLQPDIATLRAIEQFGQAILDEAFDCLGPDAMKMTELFKDKGGLIDPKVLVCKWLQLQVETISRKARHQFKEEDAKAARYSSLRLSPKLIGTVDQPVLNPTCLGKSILITSFFAKTDTPILHGGVILSGAQLEQLTQAKVIEEIRSSMKSQQLDVPDMLEQGLIESSEENIHGITGHRGFHAATYVKLTEGLWVQLDPNYGHALIDGANARYLDAAYQDLMPSGKDTKGQPSYKETRFIIDQPDDVFIAKIATEMAHIKVDPQKIKDILQNTPTAEVYAELVQELFADLMPEDDKDSDGNAPLHEIRRLVERAVPPGSPTHKYLQYVIAHVFETYVFTDCEKGGYLEGIERCKNDQAYLQRRVEDLCVLPFMFILSLDSTRRSDKKSALGRGGFGHPYVELGSPAYRVGASVLSDIAGEYGDELPLSWWLAHWPSHVSLAEHLNQTPSTAQRQLAETAIRSCRDTRGGLTYSLLNSIL